MKIWRRNINAFFWALALMCVLSACKTTEEKKEAKEQTLIKIHLEVVSDNNSDRADVPVYRSRPMMVHIDTKEILNNMDITGASVVDVRDGFGIRITFDAHGSRVLENISSRNMGRRLVIYAAWPEIRWLAAPLISHRLGNGELVFTPDATHEEAERIVRGINNVAKKVAKGGQL
jgi:preprotein translocase subunit SecD